MTAHLAPFKGVGPSQVSHPVEGRPNPVQPCSHCSLVGTHKVLSLMSLESLSVSPPCSLWDSPQFGPRFKYERFNFFEDFRKSYSTSDKSRSLAFHLGWFLTNNLTRCSGSGVADTKSHHCLKMSKHKIESRDTTGGTDGPGPVISVCYSPFIDKKNYQCGFIFCILTLNYSAQIHYRAVRAQTLFRSGRLKFLSVASATLIFLNVVTFYCVTPALT